LSHAKLALFDGTPVRDKPFPTANNIGEEEISAVENVMRKGILSNFVGAGTDEFYGGEAVRNLESNWSAHFKCKHSVSVNSATSGLYAAIGAAGINPGDEVIVSPYTMSASATCALVYGGIPIFADIDPDTFCLSPQSIRKNITPKTKAIVVVNLFGLAADLVEIMNIAKEFNLIVIEDNAQAPGALYNNQFTGTIAHMGVFSLNCFKTIQSGEGGMVCSNHDIFYEKLCLIRNHAEAVIDTPAFCPSDISNLIGFNYRLTEIQAAIANEQLKKLNELNTLRIQNVDYLNEKFKAYPFITTPNVPKGSSHVYYVHALKYQGSDTLDRKGFLKALSSEGVQLPGGYVKPLYLLPLFQQQLAFGNSGYPFTLKTHEQIYQKGLCPVTEKMHFESLIVNTHIHNHMQKQDLDDIVTAIDKIAYHYF
jgi:perosamine synthetase